MGGIDPPPLSRTRVLYNVLVLLYVQVEEDRPTSLKKGLWINQWRRARWNQAWVCLCSPS